MKKFGTPIAAGPGVASDRVGLASVGTPSGRVMAFGFAAALWRSLRASRLARRPTEPTTPLPLLPLPARAPAGEEPVLPLGLEPLGLLCEPPPPPPPPPPDEGG